MPGTFIWKINKIISSEVANPIVIGTTEFMDDYCKIVVEFTEGSNGLPITLKLTLNKNVKLKFLPKNNKYQYDYNKDKDYIASYNGTEKIGTPWNFIENGKSLTLETKVIKKKSAYAINNIISSDPSLTINPTKISRSLDPITFTSSGSNTHTIEVSGCDATNPELLIFAASLKNVDVYFYQMCETDDDVPNYCASNRALKSDCVTQIMSPNFVCIDGGVDGTIDEMYKTVNGSNLILSEGDSLVIDSTTHIWQVMAGKDLYCGHVVHPSGPPQCSNTYNPSAAIDVANKTFGKVGVKVHNKGVVALYENFDLVNEDLVMTTLELGLFMDRRYGHEVRAPKFEVYLVNAISADGTTRGASAVKTRLNLFYPLWACQLDVNRCTSRTFAHEMGHGYFGLQHPGGQDGEFGFEDLNNFMNGGGSERINKFQVLRYQFAYFH